MSEETPTVCPHPTVDQGDHLPNRDHHPTIGSPGFAIKNNIFFAAVEMTRMPMIVTDPNQPDNPVVFANEAFLQMSGFPPEEVISHNCRFLQGPETNRDTIDDVRRAIEERTQIAVEVLNYRRDGTAFWNALYISPVFGDDGHLLYYFGSQLDVTRRRETEAALHQAQKMEAVGQLTGGIAHDFNNLLTVMIGNLESLLLENDHGRRQGLIERVLSAATKGSTLTQQLLAFARKQILHEQPSNITVLVEGLTDLVRRTLGSDIRIVNELERAAWVVSADRVQAELAVLNIVFNARDAIRAQGGDGHGCVVLRTANRTVGDTDPLLGQGLQPGNYAVISIHDNGSGIPPEILSRVTEPFFTTKDVGAGSGMGLAMVYGFMRQSRGHLVITSEIGHGTTVSLYFPALESQNVVRAASSGGPYMPRAKPGEVVLIVEDNPEVLDLAERVLSDYGYATECASSAEGALKILRADRRIDMLFTDIVMPGGMNGITLARLALGMRGTLSVLITTGFTDRAASGDSLGGEFEVLAKPYRRADLLARVRRVLDRHGTGRV